MDEGTKVEDDDDDGLAIDATGQEKSRGSKFSLRDFLRLIYIIGMDADASDTYGRQYNLCRVGSSILRLALTTSGRLRSLITLTLRR